MRYNTGEIQEQLDGCKCFIPSKLPFDPPFDYTPGITLLLSEADRAISFMDGTVEMVPNLELLSLIFARKEALLSAQIEGTEATFSGFLSYEANLESDDNPEHLKQVSNLFKALTEGVNIVNDQAISIGLICNLHKILMKGVRGQDKMPGIIRPIQNFVGGVDCYTAKYVPPPQEYVRFRLDNLIDYIQSEDNTPPLVKAAIIYAYFEMIHPFLDGNGRLGRLLIILFLFQKKVLRHQFLTISYYLKEKRGEHYRLLGNISKEGDIEAWILYFLNGIIAASNLTSDTARSIKRMSQDLEDWVITNNVGGIYGIKMNRLLFSKPIFTIANVRDYCDISHQAASRLVKKYVDAGYIVERTGKSRYRQYLYKDFVLLLSEGTDLPTNDT
jgi:Fic family protein